MGAAIEKVMVGKTRSYDPETHSVIWTLNSGNRDAYGERLLGSGHKTGPHVNVIDHHYKGGATIEAILGMVEKTWAEEEATVGKLVFGDDHPRMIAAEKMVASGILRNASVGVDIISYKDGEDGKEIEVGDDFMYWPRPGRIYPKWILRELSMVGVPADGEALARMVRMCDAFGKIDDETPLPITEITGGETLPDRVREVLRTIGLLDDVEGLRQGLHELRKKIADDTPPLTVGEQLFGKRRR